MNKTGKRNITISIFIVLFLALIVIGTNASGLVLGESNECPAGPLCECGNGILEPGEDCDDGNTDDGDGCSSECDIEYLCERWACLEGLEKDFFVTGRYGDHLDVGAWELAIWEYTGGDPSEVVREEDNYVWDSNQEVDFSLSYNPSDGDVEFTVGDKTLEWTYESGKAFEYIIPFAKGNSDGNSAELTDMELNGESLYDLNSYDNYYGFKIPLSDSDQINGFTITGKVKLIWDSNPRDEIPGFHIFAMNTHDLDVCESDDENPVTSNVDVDPYFNNGIFDLTAFTEDEFSNIVAAEYFLGHVSGAYCGDWGTGTPMDAVDGFDELEEDLIKENAEYIADGVNWVCVQSKDACDQISNCACISFETDTIPPQCVFDIMLDDELNPDEYLICGDDPELTGKVCDDQAGIQGGEYFIDWIIPPVPDPWDGEWMDVYYEYQDDGLLCAKIGAIVDTSELGDGTHYLMLRGKDKVENWGKISQCPKVSFIKDTTPPVVEKEIDFAEDISVECSIQEIMGKTITRGCDYVLPGTEITLDAYDPDPQETGEFAGDVVIYYKVWWSYDGVDWIISQEGYSNVDEPISFTLNEDSYHLVEFWATDGCGLESEHWFELDIVDSKEPEGIKTIGTPKIPCEEGEGCDYWVRDHVTEITLDCIDNDPHPVGKEKLYYKISFDDLETPWLTRDYCTQFGGTFVSLEGTDGWCVVDLWELEVPYIFTFQEDSLHDLEFYCEDGLGNKNNVDIEWFKVDSIAPETTKTYGNPIFPIDGYPKWITSDTEITLTAEDGGDICHVDGVTTKYRYAVVEDHMCYDNCYQLIWEPFPPEWNEYTGPFTMPQDSCHYIEYRSEDALGNVEDLKYQCVFVDNEEPLTTKIVGLPKVKVDENCNEETEICDYWVTQGTQITLDCIDNDPHPVGKEKLYYKISFDDPQIPWLTEQYCDEFEGYFDEASGWCVADVYSWTGPYIFNFMEDSQHDLEFYCEDALGNKHEPIIEYDNVDTAPPQITKFVIKEDEERIYAAEGETITIVGVQSEGTLTYCAEVDDVKLTGDSGVGVDEVWGRLVGLVDPEFELEWNAIEQAYCAEYSLDDCGRWHFEVWANDSLGNEADWTNGIEIIIDNVPPIGEVLNPHAGNSYYPGKIFPFYAPAVDFGGDECCEENTDCPASGVDYCDVYAIDYNFEGLDQSVIKDCYWDLIEYFDQVLEDPYKEYIGRVPYVNGVCTGYLTIDPNTQLTDTVFMAVNWTDKAGNSRFGLALNPWFSPISMNMEEMGSVQITEMFNSPVTSNDLLEVKATLEETGLAGTKECWGIVEMYGEGMVDITSFDGSVTGNVIDGFECTISASLPDYSEIDSGSYRYTVEYRLNDDWQVTVIGTDDFGFTVDNDRPEMFVDDPEKYGTYGETLPVSLYIEDDSQIAPETVLVRLHEMGIFGSDFCWGGCEDTGWIDLTDLGSGWYGYDINLVEQDITGDQEYNFDAIACDSLYDSEDLAEDILPIIAGNDKNGHHCRRISIHGAEEYIMEIY